MGTTDNITSLIAWRPRGEIESMDVPDSSTSSDVRVSSSTLFLFLDESGNFDFSDTGTDYFIMTCVATRRPFVTCHDLMDLKYDLFEDGLTMRKFHATEDKPGVREAVYDVIKRNSRRYTAYSIHTDKKRLSDKMKSADALYMNMFGWLTSEVLEKEADDGTDRIIVITDDIPQEAKRRQVAKPLKRLLKDFSERTGIPSYLEHFPSESDFNLQVADYLCWAFMRQKAKGQEWPYCKVEDMFSETGDVLLTI